MATLACVALSQSLDAQSPKGRPGTGIGRLPDATPPAAPPDSSVILAEASRLVPLPTLTEAQIREFIHDLSVQLELAKGYRAAGPAFKLPLPVMTDKIVPVATLSRQGVNRTDVLRFGYVMQPRRLPQLWVYGITVTPTAVEINGDFEPGALDPVLRTVLTERIKTLSKLSITGLESRIITLSYTDSDGALFALRAMGYSAITDDDPLPPDAAYRGLDVALLAETEEKARGREREKTEKPEDAGRPGNGFDAPRPAMSIGPIPGEEPKSAAKFPAAKYLPTVIDFERLPVIVKMPPPDPKTVGLVGGDASQSQRDQSMGLTVIPQAAAALSNTMAGGTAQLLVMFHPGYPDQFFKVKRVIDTIIDKPARQVFIEGLVLEISNEGLRELGVRWDITRGNQQLQLGTLTDVPPGNTLSFTYDSLLPDPRRILARINALVETNKAQVLSRPSVLTLDNRQATIRVGTDIPIATSKDAGTGAAGGRVAFSFQYLPTGILLNVRPRISEDLNEISMLVDATVSATVPNADLTVRDPGNNQVLASAPTISTRRVQTYARIVNNQPLIIGGLVSRDQINSHERVPGLGDIPLLGYLFGRKRDADSRREVIIVLTPYVLPEGRANFGRALPKDDSAFDSLDSQLFRDSYRLRAGDVFDTGYIRNNRRLLAYREIIARIARQRPEIAEKPTFRRVAGDRIPGEQNLINGMIYETLRRNKLGGEISANRMLVFADASGPEFRVLRLDNVLAAHGDGKDWRSFFAKNPDKALAITFESHRTAGTPGNVLEEPKPKIALVACCSSRAEWKRILWDMSTPGASGLPRHTVLIKDEADLVKLSRAITLKRLLFINGGESSATISNFLVGRHLAIPAAQHTQTHLIEAEVARFFVHTELYYPAFEDEFEASLRAIGSELARPEYREFVKEEEMPPALRTERPIAAN